jgi:hypothetical protein
MPLCSSVSRRAWLVCVCVQDYAQRMEAADRRLKAQWQRMTKEQKALIKGARKRLEQQRAVSPTAASRRSVASLHASDGDGVGDASAASTPGVTVEERLKLLAELEAKVGSHGKDKGGSKGLGSTTRSEVLFAQMTSSK